MNFIPTKEGISQSFVYLRLLFSSNPTKTDIFLIASGTIGGIAAGIPFPLLGILFGQLVDDINSSTCDSTGGSDASFESAVRTKVLQVIYVTIANFVFIYIHTSSWSLVGERLVRRMRKDYFDSLLKQEASFIDSLPSGDVVSRLVSDIEVIQTGTSEKVGIYIATLSYFVTAYVVAFIKAAPIAGMLVSVVPVFFLMAFGGGHYIKRYAGRIAIPVNAATSIASSSLSHMTLVHAFNANERLEALFSKHLTACRKDSLKKAMTHAIQLGLLYFVAYSANALAFWQGSRMIADVVAGKTSGVSVGAVYTVIFVLLDGKSLISTLYAFIKANSSPASFILSQVAPFLHIFAAAASASERLTETINRQSQIDATSPDGDHDASFETEEIEFQNVSFTYPSRPDIPVLQDVSFKIPPQKHTAIVGPSGGGKSTIVALLERLYDPTHGKILIGGRDLRDLNVRYLRGNIGLVQQEPSLLDRSILENIAYGLVSSPLESHKRLSPTIIDPSLTQLTESIRNGTPEKDAIAASSKEVAEIIDLVRKAATSSNAMEFVDSLPHGLATNVGESGSQFSGGQKQRIAVARALVREPRLLLLDEATAALDSTSEQLIQSALSKASQNTTTISIAHRLATAKDAHNIVVIQKGKVVEQGSHAGLVAQGGAYADMVSLQNLGKTGAAGSVAGDSIERSTAYSNELEPSDKDGGASDTSGFDEKRPSDQTPGDTKSKEKDEPEETTSLLSTIKHSFPLIRPNLLYIFIGLATSVIIGGSYSGEAVIFGHTVGSLSPCKEPFQIRDSGDLFGLLFFILALIEFFAVIINGSAFGWAAEKILYRVRVLSLRSLLRQSLHWHSSKGRTPGVLISHITSDAASLSSLTGTTIGILFSTLVNLVAGIVVSHVIAWKISIVLLATIPVLLASGVMRLRVLAQFQERHQKAFAQATAITVEAVDNIKSVAAFSLEKQSYEVFARALKAPYQATLKSIAYGNVWLALAYSISNLVYALAYWWGAKQIMAGLYTETQFFIVLPALLFSTQSCGQMFALAPDISKARVAATNIVNLLAADSGDGVRDNSDRSDYSEHGAHTLTEEKQQDIEASAEARGAPSTLSQNGIGVTLKDVNFTYPSRPDRIVLDGLNINIAPGQFCALVGPSGSGKSTTFSMFERFYRPTSGSVVIDGVDITKQSGTSFRDDIALVPQENVMFEGTVAFNIGLGARPNHNPTQAEIEDACRLANIHDTIISLPDGYDTVCGQDGKQFSGGQRQRLSIARALVRKPRLLLLDESTSALDVESEKHVQESLAKVAHRTTIVAIAHRLNTIHLADRIFLIDGGKCVESGTHNELVERSETYRTSVIHQSLHV